MVVLSAEEHRGQRRHAERGDRLPREQRHARVDARLQPGKNIEAERAGSGSAVQQRVDDDVFRRGVRRFDPEFAEERELLVDLRAGADGEATRGEAVTLPATQKTVITSAEERNHLIHYMRSVERIFQPKAGEAEVDRQRSGDLIVAVVEQIRRVGDRRGNAVAQYVDDDRPPVEMAEVEQLEPKVPAGRSEQRLFPRGA